jgi:hypothetical protein
MAPGVQTRNYLTDAFTFNSLAAVRSSRLTRSRPKAARPSAARISIMEKYFPNFVVEGRRVPVRANHKWATFPAVSDRGASVRNRG